MKKYILSSFLLSIAALTLFGHTTLAQTVKGNSKADIQFEKGELPSVVDPTDPNTSVTPSPGLSKPIETTDGVGVTAVPFFSFGTVKVNALSQEYPIQKGMYTKGEGEDKSTYYSPQFLQVADVSGADKLWSVSVGQDAVFTSGEGKDKQTLENTRIRLYGQTITNSLQEPGKDLIGFNQSEGYGEIPVGSTTLEVFSSKKAGFTNSSMSSLVFENNYTEESKSTEKGTSDGVKLYVPSSDKPKVNNKYTANLTWTLAVTP
ncbi:hypothetical protein IGJ02_002622 [Enterococcus sp. DIV0724b]|uniref:WxL domain-containing protein n=1 Tax=Enterococcus sp. DIV0724b TaxID=2774694 RepID=UPI003D2FF4B9